MTREEFWLQIYMASYSEFHDNWTAKRDANAALAAYDEALKEYGEACDDIEPPADPLIVRFD